MRKNLVRIALVILVVMSCFSIKAKAASTKSINVPDMELKLERKGSTKKVVLSWTSKNNKDFDGIRIYRKEKGGSYGSYFKDFSSDKKSYTDNSNDGKYYNYKIRAYKFDENGKRVYGKYSKIVSAQRYYTDDDFALDQRKVAPNGCESYALATMLHYHGVDVDPLEVCAKITISSTPYWKNGKRYGGNPNRGYLAPKGCDASSIYGWGVYTDPILKLAKKYRKNGLTNLKGSSLDEVLKFVSENGPVEVWATAYNKKSHSTKNQWIDEKTGEKVVWKSGMHALTIVGFTESEIACSDSLQGKIVWYNREVFESNYEWLERQAIGYVEE